MRTPVGFLLLMNNQDNTFEKPPLSIEAQFERLSSRGLIIQDQKAAQHYLTYISYYCFCGYAIEFEDEPINNGEKRYHQGTTFEKVLDCYVFDRKLRLLVIDAIERIEIAIRTVMINELALKYGAHWYLDQSLFLPKFRHDELIQAIKKETQFKAQDGSIQLKKRERFIQHYYDKYPIPELPAIWMVAEVLPLGSWSIIFANLVDRENQKIICKHIDIYYLVMTSWLHSLSYLRNLCAHHSKIWNRGFTLKPVVTNKYHQQLKNNTRFSAQAGILKIFLDVISPGSEWASHLRTLVKQYPMIDIRRMGFSEGWETDPFWG